MEINLTFKKLILKLFFILNFISKKLTHFNKQDPDKIINPRPFSSKKKEVLITYECLALINQKLPYILAAGTIASFIISIALMDSVNIFVLSTWLSLCILCNSLRYLLTIFYNKFNLTQIKLFYTYGSLSFSLLWIALLYYVSNSTAAPGAMILLSVVMSSTGTMSFLCHAHHPPAYYIFCIITLLGINFISFHYGAGHPICVIILSLIYFFLMVSYCRSIHNNFKLTVSLKLHNESLLKDIQKQIQLTKDASIDKSRFLTSISHDLRQPIHSLSLFANSIHEDSLSHYNKKIIDNIKLSIISQERQFTEFLDMSKLDAGNVTPNISLFSTTNLLHELQLEYNNIAREKNIKFSFSGESYKIESDLLLCQRIIRNLLANAIAYTSKGSISILVNADHDNVYISITDTGAGIKEEKQKAIFSEFIQLHSPHKDSQQGLGIGLAIVKRYCNLLKLNIKLSSTYNKGSAFTITFKRSYKLPKYETLSDSFQIKQITGAKILVIDNDPLVLEATKLHLKILKHEVLCANGLDEAISLIKANGIIPDIILCALHLHEKLNGIQIIESINQVIGKTIPSIIITGETDQASIEEVLNSTSLLLHKPLQKGKLVMALNRCLKNTRLASLN